MFVNISILLSRHNALSFLRTIKFLYLFKFIEFSVFFLDLKRSLEQEEEDYMLQTEVDIFEQRHERNGVSDIVRNTTTGASN